MSEDTKDPFGFEGASEVETGDLFKWDEEGKTLSGQLHNYEEQEGPKGVGHVYEIKNKDGIIPFFAPSLLHKKLKSVEIGEIVGIQFTGERETKNGNDVKEFHVTSAANNNTNRERVGLPPLEEPQGDE